MPIADVGVESSFDYDRHIAFQLYLNYIEGVAPLEYVLLYLKRLIILQHRKKYMKRFDPHVIDELVQTTYIEVWAAVVGQKIPRDQERLFYAYLMSIISRSRTAGFESALDNTTQNLRKSGGWTGGAFRRYATSFDVEDRIFIDELPTYIANKLMENFRFPGERVREAVGYIVDRLFNGRRIVEPWLRRQFGVRNTKFFVEHVIIRVRAMLYSLRTELTPCARITTGVYKIDQTFDIF